MFRELLHKFYENQEKALSYGWVFGIVFFLVLFLSQSLYISILGPVGSIVIWVLLLLWSFVATFFLLFGSGSTVKDKIQKMIDAFLNREPLNRSLTNVRDVPEAHRFEATPRTVDPEPIKEEKDDALSSQEIDKEIELLAHREGALIGNTGLKLISSFDERAKEVFGVILKRAKIKYPRFDGWVILNVDQLIELLDEENIEIPINYKKPKKKVIQEPIKKVSPPPNNLPTGQLRSENSGSAATFIGLLCDADQDDLFAFMRGQRAGSEGQISEFLKEVIVTLDRIHEHRVDGVGYVDREILDQTTCFSNQELEELIAILITSIDSRYSLPELGSKMALIRAIEYIKKNRSD